MLVQVHHIFPEKNATLWVRKWEHPWDMYLNPILTHALLLINRSFLFAQRIQESCLLWTWNYSSIIFSLVKKTCDFCQSLLSIVYIMKTTFLIYFLLFEAKKKKNLYNFLTLRFLVIETIQGFLSCTHLSLRECVEKLGLDLI